MKFSTLEFSICSKQTLATACFEQQSRRGVVAVLRSREAPLLVVPARKVMDKKGTCCSVRAASQLEELMRKPLRGLGSGWDVSLFGCLLALTAPADLNNWAFLLLENTGRVNKVQTIFPNYQTIFVFPSASFKCYIGFFSVPYGHDQL